MAARPYLVSLLIVVAVGVAVLAGWWWYLSGLEDDCRRKCLAAGGKGYKYVEMTTSGKRARPGICTCE